MNAAQRDVKCIAYVKLISWMVEQLAKLAVNPLAQHSTLMDHVVEHYFDSTAETMANVLWACGIVVPNNDSYQPGDGFPYEFRFVVSRDNIEDRARSLFGNEPTFDTVLSAFINRAVCFRDLSTNRSPFSVEEGLLDIMETLHDLGYTSKQGNLYSWNDSIGPIMVEHHLWTESGRSNAALAEDAFQRKMKKLPRRFQRQVASFAAQGQFLRAVEVLWRHADFSMTEAMKAVEIMHPGIRSEN